MSPPIRFLVDANVPRSVVRCLRDLGHDAHDVRDVLPDGTSDSVVFSVAQEEERMLVTHDLGFSNIIAYPPGSHTGVIVIRPQNLRPATTASLVCSYVEAHEDQLLGALIILSPGRARVRR